jgi:toxin ParE1/3/4
LSVIRRPQFVDDLSAAHAFLTERSPSAADRLLDEVEAVIDLLIRFPRVGTARDEIVVGVRSFRVRRFPYLLFYELAQNDIVLLRLLHGAQDITPGKVSG